MLEVQNTAFHHQKPISLPMFYYIILFIYMLNYSDSNTVLKPKSSLGCPARCPQMLENYFVRMGFLTA